MIIDIYCMNCHEFVLQADTETLCAPMVGSMFSLRPEREWFWFSPDAKGNDLVCPMCSWCFHLNGILHVKYENYPTTTEMKGTPAEIVKSFNEMFQPNRQKESIEQNAQYFIDKNTIKVAEGDGGPRESPSGKPLEPAIEPSVAPKRKPGRPKKQKDPALAKMGLE